LSAGVDDGNLEHIGSQDKPGKRNAHAKGARLQDVETIGGSKIVGALCQRMSKSKLTLGDT
jgi:hypothetical protein